MSKKVTPKFEDIQPSTKTFIIMTNLIFDIPKLFDFLPITDYVIVEKKRGRKKKQVITDPNADIPDGSIISLDIANHIRGVNIKKIKRYKFVKEKKFFRNSMTIIMIIDGKKINFKLTRNGKFQITGCKFDRHAEACLKFTWSYIKENHELYDFAWNPSRVEALFVPAMRNIDFSVGFTLNREKVDFFFKNYTDYISLFETDMGYTGINIKKLNVKPLTDMEIKKVSFSIRRGKWLKPKQVPCEEYLSKLTATEQKKKLNKKRYNTFLVFQSGNVIMSSMSECFAKDVYYEFIKIMMENRKKFEEKIDLL